MRSLNKIIWIILLIPLLTASLLSQEFGTIKGKILDETTNEGLPGANVILVGTRFGSATDRFGNFVIEKVPFGNYQLKVSFIGYQDFTTNVTLSKNNPIVNVQVVLKISAVPLQEVVVYGLMQGQAKAFNQELTAPDIRNVLSREEIEKFPDLNTAEALQRIPGVYTNRSLGEGTYVYIRGTEPRLTYITVDGLKLASSADQERSVDLGVVNSKQIAFVEVIKALTPDMDADGIGGAVNLITKSPFEIPQLTIRGEFGGGYAIQTKKPLYRFSLSHSELISNKIGISVNLNYYRNDISGHSNEFTWDNVKDVNGQTIPFALTDYRLFYYRTLREHYGISSTFAYKLDENNYLNLRLMYNRRDDDQSRNMIRYRLDRGTYLNATTVQNARMAFEFQNRNEVHHNYLISLGGNHIFGPFNIDYNLHYTYAKQTKDPGQIKSEWALDTRLNLTFDLSDVNFPKFTITNKDVTYIQDPSHWTIDTQDFRNINIKNNVFIGNVNLKYTYSPFGYPGEIKVGAKFKVDAKKRTGFRGQYKWRGSTTVLMSTVSTNEKLEKFLNNKYTFAPIIDNDLLRKFFNQFRGLSTGLAETVIYNDTDGSGGDYDNREDIYAAYAMTTINIGNFMILAGVRDEYTSTEYNGYQVFLDNRGNFLSMNPINQKTKYNDLFPYLHMKFSITEKTNLRFAFTRTISRPDFFDLAPYYWLDPKNSLITKGNPDLKPTTSFNYDLSFAHYFKGIGVISFGLFYKDMDRVIYPRIYQQIGGPYDGFTVTEPVNGGKAKLYGVEINWNQYFTFLPGFLGGFGIFANYTYTKSKAQLLYRDWSTMPGQAADVGNFGLTYDKYNLTARLTLNYTSPILYQVGKSPDYDRYNDKATRLDFTAIYKISKRFSVYIDWINILNTPDREYYGISSRPRLHNYYGWQLYLGIKFE